MPTIVCHDCILAGACALLLLVSAQDIAARTIANTLCLAIAALAITLRFTEAEGAPALLAAALVSGCALACWSRNWLGGGDVKLLAAASILVPPSAVPRMIAAVAIAGGVLAIGYLMLSVVVTRPGGGRPDGLLRRVARAERWRISGRRSLPYAVAIVAGVFITLLDQ